jgi:hypothetical protein
VPRKCSVCEHPKRQEIEQATLAGEAFSAIAQRYALSRDSVRRHKESGHIDAKLVAASEATEVAQADDLLQQLVGIRADADRIMRKAERAKDYRAAVSAIRELRGVLELWARLEGRLAERAHGVQVGVAVNLPGSPQEFEQQWKKTKAAVFEALDHYPEAKAEVIRALEGGSHAD